MKQRDKILLLLLLPITSHALSTASMAAITASNASAQHQVSVNNQEQMMLASSKTSSQVEGVMTCTPGYRDIPGLAAYDISGCKTGEQIISIKKFFIINRISEDLEIIQVIYNDHKNLFSIYYGRRAK